MKKNAQLNKYGAILLLSDLWCAYDWGDANVSYDQVLKNEWALSPQTNINNIVVDVKTKDGTFSRRTLQFNDADWKMYLEVKDTNGDRAVFTPNNSNGTIRIKKNGTNTDITTLKLVQGRVTKQMNKGIIESSKHNFDMFKGGYGSPSYNTNQWKPEYAQNLNQYTTYFVRTVNFGGKIGSVDLFIKATNIIDVNCSGCLTYAMSKPTIVNQQAIKINKRSINFDKNKDSKNVQFSITGDNTANVNLTLNGEGSATDNVQIPMPTDKDEFEIDVKEVYGNGFKTTPENGYHVKFKSKYAINGINHIKIWSYSLDNGNTWSEYEEIPNLNFINAKPKVTYTTDGHGTLSKNEEIVDINGSPEGVKDTPNEGYNFKNYVVNKDVKLRDGTVIKAGNAIEENQISQIVVEEDIEIQAVHESKIDISLDDRFTCNQPVDKVYNGQEQKWTPTIKDNVTGKDLVEGVDYDVVYSQDLTNVGDVTVSIKGKGIYQGEKPLSYKITPKKVKLTANSAEKEYDGNPISDSGYSVSDGGFVKGEEFDIRVTGEQTFVGESSNTITAVTPKGNAKKENYTIELVPGILKVTDGTKNKPIDSNKVIKKSHDNSKTYRLGEVVEFTIEATNIYGQNKNMIIEEQEGVTITGNTRFENVEPGKTVTTTAQHTVTEADILKGTVYTNKVSVSFENGKKFENTDKVAIETKNSKLTVNKRTVSTPKDGNVYALGEKIEYGISVTNSGNLTVKNIEVNDELTGDKWTVKELAPGQTSETFRTSYTVTEKDVLAGTVKNKATAKGESPDKDNLETKVDPGIREEAVETSKPSFVVIKEPQEGSYKLGETVVYNIKVINNGNVSINDINVRDDLTGDTWTIDTLKPGEEKELTAKYVITEDNILDGEIVNVASAKGQDPKGNDIEETGSSTITPEEINAHMIVNKKTVSNPKDGKSYKYGEEIKYEITVTNDGNVTLYNVNVSDKLTGDKWTIKELTPGETSKVFKTSYKVTEKDVLAGSVVNTATATSDDILDKITPEVVPGKQEENVEAAISSVLVEKKAKEGTYKVGNTVTYEIKVINNGNVTVSGIKVIDELTGDKWTIDNLKPGEEKIFTTKYVIKKADEDRGYVKNTVKVEGLGSNGKDVSVNGESTIKVEKTEVVTKPTTGDDTQLILWATLAITCGGIIIYLTSKIRRKEEK